MQCDSRQPNPRKDDALIVRLEGVSKSYERRIVLKDVSLSIRPGELVGLVGPNGAGKTTIMKILAGLCRASCGEVTVLGHDLTHARGALHTPDGIGLLLEQIGFVPYMSARQNLALLARIRNRISMTEIAKALEAVDLDIKDRRMVSAYSLGMRQRLGLAQALMEQPRLLLLDEPTNGLDPAGIVSIRKLLRTLADSGTTILLASHVLTELERVCDRILLTNHGRILKEISMKETRMSYVRVEVSGARDIERLHTFASQRAIPIESDDTRADRSSFLLHTELKVAQLVRELVVHDVQLDGIVREQRSLEAEFFALLGSNPS
jgi:ABC-type multidrug transport system ATPase subunit